MSSAKLWGTSRATQRWRVRPSASVSRLAVTVPGTSSISAEARSGSSLGATMVISAYGTGPSKLSKTQRLEKVSGMRGRTVRMAATTCSVSPTDTFGTVSTRFFIEGS